MKMRLWAYVAAVTLMVAVPAALLSLATADIKFENKTLTYKGETIDRLCVTFGASSICYTADDIIEIKTPSQAAGVTIITKKQVIVLDEASIKGIVVDRSKSYIDIKL